MTYLTKKEQQAYQAKVLCASFTPEQLREHLDVSLRTAQRYRIGDAQPCRAGIKLLRLHRAGRILPDSWPNWISINNNDTLNAGAYEFSYSELEHYGWIKSQYSSAMILIRELEQKLSIVTRAMNPAQKIAMIPTTRHLWALLTERDNPKRRRLPTPDPHRKYGA